MTFDHKARAPASTFNNPKIPTALSTESTGHSHSPMAPTGPQLEWDWDLEHQDRKLEAKADAASTTYGAAPFQVDRRLLKDIVQEKMGKDVARIKFLGAGTFHKGYLITLADSREVVTRVARRFMPHLKTESEVATMRYLRENTNIPVPTIIHHDSNPYNRLGGEFIIMTKAVGVPLAKVFHSLAHNELMALMENIAMLVIPLYGHRFPKIGSLYNGRDPDPLSESTSIAPTPTATHYPPRPFSMTPVLKSAAIAASNVPPESDFHVGPIISWPFFGSGRGELVYPDDINRGPWRTTHSYLLSSAEREVRVVKLENEGKAAPHRLHLDPDKVQASRHHRVGALPDDESDKSDEYDWDESEEEWEGPGDTMYRDYRRMQRGTFLLAHLDAREQKAREEMNRFISMMERLGVLKHEGDGGGGNGAEKNEVVEEFALDCHDLSLENVFVDEHDHSKITSIIDWESTTTRPLWAAAHVPAFLSSSPFTAKLFRLTVEKLSTRPDTIVVNGKPKLLSDIATEWLHHEASGVRLRMAHRCIEWDGWEEGLVDSILGSSDQDEDWFKTWDEGEYADGSDTPAEEESPDAATSPTLTESESGSSEGGIGLEKRNIAVGANNAKQQHQQPSLPAAKGRAAVPMVAKVVAVEKEKEKLLNATGDYCGGRGGELGRRLDAWLFLTGDAEGRVQLNKKWEGDVDEDVEGVVRP